MSCNIQFLYKLRHTLLFVLSCWKDYLHWIFYMDLPVLYFHVIIFHKNSVNKVCDSFQIIGLYFVYCILSGMVHTGVEACRMDSELSELVEWPWLQLICCTVCLPHGRNFRWWGEVWDRNECWLVYRHWTPEIEFNKSLSLLIIRLANYNVTTSLIY